MLVSRWNLKVKHDIAKYLPKIFISYCGGFTVMSSSLLLCPHGRTETALLERQCKWDQVWKVMECNRCPVKWSLPAISTVSGMQMKLSQNLDISPSTKWVPHGAQNYFPGKPAWIRDLHSHKVQWKGFCFQSLRCEVTCLIAGEQENNQYVHPDGRAGHHNDKRFDSVSHQASRSRGNLQKTEQYHNYAISKI